MWKVIVNRCLIEQHNWIQRFSQGAYLNRISFHLIPFSFNLSILFIPASKVLLGECDNNKYLSPITNSITDNLANYHSTFIAPFDS